MNQASLLDNVPAIPVNVSVTHPAERKRLSAQCALILNRLREGDATNLELSQLSIKYTGRISDCRAAGYVIKVVERNYETGVSTYRLISEPQRGQK